MRQLQSPASRVASTALSGLTTALYYLTVIGPLRDYIRQSSRLIALEILNEQGDSLRSMTHDEIARRFMENVGRQYERKRLITQIGEPQKIIDTHFDTPTDITIYFDLRDLRAETHDAIRIGLFLGIRGEDDGDLVQINSGILEAPQEEALTIGPATVVGRTVITLRHQVGEDNRVIWYQLHTSQAAKSA